MTRLPQKRKADREHMADQLCAIAAKFGAEVERDDHRLDPDEIHLQFRLPGASVSIGLKPAAEGPGGYGFLGHWVCDRGYLFNPDFFSRHPRPHHKATTYEDDFWVFAAHIQSGLRRLSKGTVFASVPAATSCLSDGIAA
ncbi:MAG: hypothetical protein Q8R98_01650 [Rubrivivax sp.]|nr:hypothetical protein [Rubrivivax sp.]